MRGRTRRPRRLQIRPVDQCVPGNPALPTGDPAVDHCKPMMVRGFDGNRFPTELFGHELGTSNFSEGKLATLWVSAPAARCKLCSSWQPAPSGGIRNRPKPLPLDRPPEAQSPEVASAKRRCGILACRTRRRGTA